MQIDKLTESLDRYAVACERLIPAQTACQMLGIKQSALRNWYWRKRPYAPPRVLIQRDYFIRFGDLVRTALRIVKTQKGTK